MANLKTLLNEVSEGNYENFRAYLFENKIRDLNLSHIENPDYFLLGYVLAGTHITYISPIKKHNLTHLGNALKGTQVTHVNLSWNRIGSQRVKDFGEALKGSQVRSVDLSWNRIGSQGAKYFGEALAGTQVTHVKLNGNKIGKKGAKKFAACIPDTCLLYADLGVVSPPELSAALKLNNEKYINYPYQLVALLQTYLGELTLKKDALKTPGGQFRYGLEILAHQNLPIEVGLEIIGYLPLMKGRNEKNKPHDYLDALEKRRQKRGMVLEFKKLKL